MPEPLEYLPEMGSNEELPVKELGDNSSGQDQRQFSFGYPGPERRDGLDRRQFSFGYPGPERRDGLDRRERNEPLD
jgi:hypothetical protein